MSPPIRDGSGNDIGAIRLGDGSEISEVRTGAGDVLFSGFSIPDSAIAQFDAREISANDGDPLSSWENLVTGNNATANSSPTYNASSLNGNPAVNFDGSNDYFDISLSASGDFVYYAVIDLNLAQNNTILTNQTNDRAQMWYSEGSSPNGFRIFNGSSNIFGTDTAANILSGQFTTDSTDEILREDESQTAKGNAGSGTLNSLRIGANQKNNNNCNGDILFIEVHEAPVSNGFVTREGEIASEFGI